MLKYETPYLHFALGDLVWVCVGEGSRPVQEDECPACKGVGTVLLDGGTPSQPTAYRCPHRRCEDGQLVYYEYRYEAQPVFVDAISSSHRCPTSKEGGEIVSTCSATVGTNWGEDDERHWPVPIHDIYLTEEECLLACEVLTQIGLKQQKSLESF